MPNILRFLRASAALGLVAAPCCVVRAHAQAPLAVSVEGGALHAYDRSLFQAGMRAAPRRGGFGSFDFALATYPELFGDGVFLVAMDLAGTYGVPQRDSPVVFFPRAGLSLMTNGRFSGTGGGAAAGYHAGAGVFVRGSARLGLRVDYTYRRFPRLDTAFSSITTGLVFTR